jgi:hypothetical protein
MTSEFVATKKQLYDLYYNCSTKQKELFKDTYVGWPRPIEYIIREMTLVDTVKAIEWIKINFFNLEKITLDDEVIKIKKELGI